MTEEEYRNTPKERCFAPTIYLHKATSYVKDTTCAYFKNNKCTLNACMRRGYEKKMVNPLDAKD